MGKKQKKRKKNKDMVARPSPKDALDDENGNDDEFEEEPDGLEDEDSDEDVLDNEDDPDNGDIPDDGDDVPGDGDGRPGDESPADADLDRQTRQIIETGSVTIEHGRHLIHCLTIIGQVEGHFILPPQNKTTKYEHVIPQIVAIEEDKDIEGLLILLNTVGGDVEAGLAIAELVAGMKKPTVSLVLGGGHSIGVPLAVCARQSFIVPTATMTVHPVRMNGIVVGVPQTLSYFDRMQDRIINFVTANSHITAKKFRQLMMTTGELVMDVGTVLDGQGAVDAGLIDSLGGLSDAISCLYDMIEHPENQKRPAGRGGKSQKSTKDVKRKAERPRRAKQPAEAARGADAHAVAHHRPV